MVCWCSPYKFPGHKGALWLCWGAVVGLPWGDVAHSGGIQLGQGAVVPEVVGSALVKVFLVPVEAHQGKAFLEDLVL